MERFYSSLKTERTARKVYTTRDAARADVFDYIELLQPSAEILDTGLSEPCGVRGKRYASLTSCPWNRQQATVSGSADLRQHLGHRRPWHVVDT